MFYCVGSFFFKTKFYFKIFFFTQSRSGIYLGTVLTFLGGLIRGVSTLPFLANSIDKNVQFWLGFVGQTLTGMGNPMAVSVPTKVRFFPR
jgi:hypothetical protein